MDNVLEPAVEPVIAPPTPPAPTPDPNIDPEIVKQVQQKAFGYAMSMIDEALKEAGYDKGDNKIKTTEYLKQILTEKGTKTDSQTVITPDGDTESRLKALQAQILERDQAIEALKLSTSTQKREFFLENLLDSAPIYAPEHLGEAEKQRYITRARKAIKEELTANYQIKEDGSSFRFYTSDGEAIFDGTADMNFISPKDLLNREFSEFLSKPSASQATPSPRGTGTKELDKQVSNSIVPPNLKTRHEFYEYLQNEKKYLFGDKNFLEAVKKAQEEKPSLFK
jgi:hypothetical protein